MRHPDTIYRGRRLRGEAVVTVQAPDDGNEAILDPRLDLANHSPTGFEWGYGGSGPAQLALALLADVLESDDRRAQRHYQRFKFAAIATIQADEWRMTAGEIIALIDRYEVESGGRPGPFS